MLWGCVCCPEHYMLHVEINAALTTGLLFRDLRCPICGGNNAQFLAESKEE